MGYQTIIITGTSGAGKSTVARKLCEKHEILHMVQALTTRKPREDDRPHEYKHVSEEEFGRLEREGKLWIKSKYRGESYAIANEALQQAIDKGSIPLLILTPKSVEEIVAIGNREPPQFLTVFLDAPDDVLDGRFIAQGQEVGKAVAEQRRRDRGSSAACLYLVKNVDVEKTTELIWTLWEYGKTGGILPKRLIQLMMECGMLLENAEAENVSGASYDLSLGDQYWQDGKRGTLSRSESFIELKPGDYAIVSSREIANFPRDIVGRFDLSVSLFCQGIILSNGPQVDPGFKGRLFCLLFNTSDATITLKRGQHYATLEFIKSLEPTIPYSGDYQGKEDIIDYLPKPAAPSAIVRLTKEVEKLKSESWWVKILPIVVAIAALVVAMLAALDLI